jgi:hypothetical protein
MVVHGACVCQHLAILSKTALHRKNELGVRVPEPLVLLTGVLLTSQ